MKLHREYRVEPGGQAGNSATTGLNCSFALYAEAYRRVAEQAGVLPREMQSITWEAVRGLFRPEQKNEKIKIEQDRIWSAVTAGEKDASSAREKISKLVGGIVNPAWVQSTPGENEAGQDSSYAGELPALGRDAGTPGRGDGVGAAGAVQRDSGQGGLNVESPRRQLQGDRQFELDLERLESARPDPSQAGPEGAAARRVATGLVRDLHATGTVLGKALSGDLAARQRTNLVGQVASTPEELATLAQLYRDPRLETFRLVFTNDAGAIVSQVGLTARMPASAPVIVGNDLFEYAKEVSEAAWQRGATSYFMLHNHPSGADRPYDIEVNHDIRGSGVGVHQGRGIAPHPAWR